MCSLYVRLLSICERYKRSLAKRLCNSSQASVASKLESPNLSFPRHPVHEHTSSFSKTHTRIYRRRVRVRCTPFSVTKGGRKRSGNGWWGCLSREFSARIRWPVLRPGLIPNKNMRDIFAGQTRTSACARAPRSHAGRKKGTKAPDAFVRRCATHVLLSDRARAKYSPR